MDYSSTIDLAVLSGDKGSISFGKQEECRDELGNH